jgi:hypothetical protein
VKDRQARGAMLAVLGSLPGVSATSWPMFPVAD